MDAVCASPTKVWLRTSFWKFPQLDRREVRCPPGSSNESASARPSGGLENGRDRWTRRSQPAATSSRHLVRRDATRACRLREFPQTHLNGALRIGSPVAAWLHAAAVTSGDRGVTMRLSIKICAIGAVIVSV